MPRLLCRQGPVTNIKGVAQHAAADWDPPDNVPRPATANDYAAVTSCLELLRAGLFTHEKQFLYCSILVPHPPCATP